MSLTEPTVLDSLIRGDRFLYYFTLTDALIADFEELWFTLRKVTPSSLETTDAKAVAQAIMTGDTEAPLAGTITAFAPTVGSVYFPSSVTTQFEVRTYYADLQGRLSGQDIQTLDFLRLPVVADFGRTT